MDLTKIKLHADPKMTYGGIPVYLLIAGSKRLLVTSPVLKKRREDLWKTLRQADPPMDTGIAVVDETPYPLVKGGYAKTVRSKGKVVRKIKKLPADATRIYRVHPNRLSEKQREKMVGPGEQGRYRAEFVEEGLTSEERKHRAQEQSALQMAEHAKAERAVKKQRRQLNKGRRDFGEPAEEKEPRFEGISVKEIADRAELEPTEVRRFLRLKKIGKRGGRYAFTEKEAKKIVRAVVKYYAD